MASRTLLSSPHSTAPGNCLAASASLVAASLAGSPSAGTSGTSALIPSSTRGTDAGSFLSSSSTAWKLSASAGSNTRHSTSARFSTSSSRSGSVICNASQSPVSPATTPTDSTPEMETHVEVARHVLVHDGADGAQHNRLAVLRARRRSALAAHKRVDHALLGPVGLAHHVARDHVALDARGLARQTAAPVDSRQCADRQAVNDRPAASPLAKHTAYRTISMGEAAFSS